MSLPLLILGAQAAGIAFDAYGRHKQHQANKKDYRAAERAYNENIGNLFQMAAIEVKQLDIQMQEDQLVSTEESLMASQGLREILATQRAVIAARGQAAGAGTARVLSQPTVQKFNMDEFARSVNKSFRVYQSKSLQNLTMLNAQNRQSDMKFELEGMKRGVKNQRNQLIAGFGANLANTVSGSAMGSMMQGSKPNLQAAPNPGNVGGSYGRRQVFGQLARLGR